MKKFLLMVAVAAMLVLADSQLASARRGGCGGGCGGGRHGGRHGGGCGGNMGGCGGYMGGCGGYMGGCGSYMGGCGGYMMGGCGGCGGHGGIVQATGSEATLLVNLPEDAILSIDGEQTLSTSANRVFVTPVLEEGKAYEYTLKAQVTRDGKTQVATATVTVRPGQISQVELTIPAAGVAAQ